MNFSLKKCNMKNMENIENFTAIQKEIYKAFTQLSEKASFTEFILAKKIRENTGFAGKRNAGLSLNDILSVIEVLNSEEKFYSVHINSVNEILIKKENAVSELALEAKQRRQKSEKSMVIFTSSDVSKDNGKSGKGKKSFEKRSNRKKLSVYGNYDEE